MRLVLHIQDILLHFCKPMCFSYDISGLFNQYLAWYNQPNYIQRTGLMGPSHSLHWHLHMSNIRRAVRYRFTSFSNSIKTRHSPLKCSACLFVPDITFAVAFSLIFCAWIYPENRFKKKSQAVISGHQAWNCLCPAHSQPTVWGSRAHCVQSAFWLWSIIAFIHVATVMLETADVAGRGREGPSKKSLQLEERVRRKEW